MSIDRLLATIRLTRSILVSESEIWLNLDVAQETAKRMDRALRRHRAGVKLLLSWSDCSTCPNPDLHRQYWYYVPQLKVYRCALCARLNPAC